MIRSGMLRSKITIQKKAAVPDDIGQISEKWADFYTCRCYANRENGEEAVIAAALGQRDTVVFSCRYCSALAEVNSVDYRIVFGGAVFNILSVDNVQYLNREIKLRAKEAE